MTLGPVTRMDIEDGLHRLGMGRGDTVFMHSSLRSFGHVEGGADTVIDALLQVIGPRGNVIMPTFTWGLFHDKHGVVFDMALTPSETGRITEVFRHRPGVLRSPHICHSVAAAGACAREFVADTPSVYDDGGPFDALLRHDAWNLFAGVTFTSCTTLHMVEERMRVPYRRYRDFADCLVRHPDGSLEPSRSVEFLRLPGYRNDFARMEDIFRSRSVLRETTVGRARLLGIRIRDIVSITQQLLEGDIRFLVASGP